MHCCVVFRGAVQGSAAQGPCILVHPLENIQEVQQQQQQQQQQLGGGGGGSGGGFWEEAEQVVWSGTDVPYLVTHNTVRCGCGCGVGAAGDQGVRAVCLAAIV